MIGQGLSEHLLDAVGAPWQRSKSRQRLSRFVLLTAFYKIVGSFGQEY